MNPTPMPMPMPMPAAPIPVASAQPDSVSTPPSSHVANGVKAEGEGLPAPGTTPEIRSCSSALPDTTTAAAAAEAPHLVEPMADPGPAANPSQTLGLQHDRYSQYIGPTTDFEPSLINLSAFDPKDESMLTRGTIRRVSEHDIFLLLPDAGTPGHQHQARDADEIERIVSPHGRRLVDLYFQVVHPAFPILQKYVFLKEYGQSHRQIAPPLLAAVYILAINWWAHCLDLAHLPRPHLPSLERLMRSTYADALYRPKLSTVQAGLLLSQRPEGDQWAPTAQLVAISQELGLHLDCSGWKIPPWERSLRKRLAWALYMQDKWGALVHGRPSHIVSSDWAVPVLSDHDFPDAEWDEAGDPALRFAGERGRLTFQAMVRLSAILAEILDTFYTLAAGRTIATAAERGTHLVLSLAKPIQLKLKLWFSGLLPMIRLENSYRPPPSPPVVADAVSAAAAGGASSSSSSSYGGRGGAATTIRDTDPSRFPSVGYLHLAYFAVEITLHRRIIRSMANPSGDCSDPYLQHMCRTAAKSRLITAMDFVNRLTPSHLRAFWFFASKTNFALIGTFGSLLWATSPTREEADWYRRRLGEYRWTLSVSSKPDQGSGLTAFAVTMLDISAGLLKQLPEKPQLSRTASTTNVEVLGSVAANPAAPYPYAPLSIAASLGITGLELDSSGEYTGSESPSCSDEESSDQIDE